MDSLHPFDRVYSFLYRNVFTWGSKYQVFGTDSYINGALVQATTEAAPIQFGRRSHAYPALHCFLTAIIDS